MKKLFRTLKGKRWVKRIINKNSAVSVPVDYNLFIDKTDKAALSALKAIPLFDKVCSKIMTIINDPIRNIIDMSSKIHISEKQVPKVYFMVKSICNKLGIEMPDLYLELDRTPNACTYGTEKFVICITSGLLECMEDDELYAVLAHECGHIVCNHVLYHTIGRIVLNEGHIGLGKLESLASSTLIGSLVYNAIDTSLELAFYHWLRCSEISADRVAVYCCESASPVIETMMRLAGGTTHIDFDINKDLFINQAKEYQDLTDDSKIHKALEYCFTFDKTHPLLAVRAYKAKEWAESKEFSDLVL